MRLRPQDALLAALTAATVGLSVALHRAGAATWVEAVAVVTGAVCVWLTVRESIWNYPLGLLNVTASAIVFFRARLFADAGLQVVYFGLAIAGWYLWLRGGANRAALQVTRVGRTEAALVAAAGAVLTVSLWQLLRHVGGSAAFVDALTTSLCLCAQWLLNRKRLENWACWIVADVIYIPLYVYKDLWLTAFLYFVLLCMATAGLLRWRATYRERLRSVPGFPVVLPAAGPRAAAAGVGP